MSGKRLRWPHLRWSGLRCMLRAVTVDVTVKTVEPTPTAVVVAATTWAEFPAMWGPMLDEVWSFLRGGAPAGLYRQGHNIMLYKDDVPHVEVGVQVSGSFDPAGHVVPSALPGGLVATAMHTGPIAEIGDTHQAVCEWSKANGYRLAGLAGRSTAIPTRRAAISTCKCPGRWWRRNQDVLASWVARSRRESAGARPSRFRAGPHHHCRRPLPGDLRDALDRIHSRSSAH